MDRTLLIIALAVVGVLINLFFGLYNLKVTKRVKTLTKTQSAIILIIDIVNTSHCFIHLLINIIIGAYKKN